VLANVSIPLHKQNLLWTEILLNRWSEKYFSTHKDKSLFFRVRLIYPAVEIVKWKIKALYLKNSQYYINDSSTILGKLRFALTDFFKLWFQQNGCCLFALIMLP